jgi:hypothetical protein
MGPWSLLMIVEGNLMVYLRGASLKHSGLLKIVGLVGGKNCAGEENRQAKNLSRHVDQSISHGARRHRSTNHRVCI